MLMRRQWLKLKFSFGITSEPGLVRLSLQNTVSIFNGFFGFLKKCHQKHHASSVAENVPVILLQKTFQNLFHQIFALTSIEST